MTESVDNWDVLDELISRDEDNRKDHEKLSDTRRPTTLSARRTAAVADDWLGLRPNSSNAEVTPYEPSTRGRSNLLKRQNFRQGTSRSVGLLFSDEDFNENNNDDIDDDKNVVFGENKKKTGQNVFDLFDETSSRHNDSGGNSIPTTMGINADTINRSSTKSNTDTMALPRRRETSPSISNTTTKNNAEKMPSWLSGLIQQNKDETTNSLTSSNPVLSIKKTVTASVPDQKLELNENKITNENSVSILSLIKGKDELQSTILHLIQELKKKKQDIHQATVTLIQDQQNSDLLIKTLLMDNNQMMNVDGQELEHLRSENYKFQLTIDHLSKKHELELDTIKTKYELKQNTMNEKLNRFVERINELEEERKSDIIKRKENEKCLKETYEERLRMIHESHLIDLKQSTEAQKIKMNHLEEVESSLRDSKPKRLTSEELTAREISISTQNKKLKDLQEEIDKQISVLEGERSALQMKIDEFQSRNQRERNELELASKELKRSLNVFEEGRKTWEREKKSEIQYIESRKQELEAVRSSVMEEQRKLTEERYEVASERYRLESMLKLDNGKGIDLIQTKIEMKENFKELNKKEKELEKRLELIKEKETRLTEEKHKLQEQDDEIKLKSIRTEKMLKIAILKQEEGLKALENAKDIQNKFDKKGKDIQNRLMDIIKREENVIQEETKLSKEKDAFYKQRKKLDLILPQLSADEMYFLNPNKYKAEKEIYYKKTQLN